MSMTLMYGARGFADATLGQASGEACVGFYRILFQVSMQVFGADPPADLRDLRMDVTLPGHTPARVGRLLPEPQFLPIRSYPQARPTQAAFALELDAARLEGLEAARNGGDVKLQLTWLSTIADPNGTLYHDSRPEPFEINQTSWIKVLNQLGYAKLMLLEVPLFDGLGTAFGEAAAHLRKARDAMLRGEYREAVGCCRDVIEALTRALGDKDEQLKKLLDDTRALDKADRLRLVRQALKVLTHPARHADEVAAAIDWTRTDAAAVITMTAAIMQELAAPGARTLAATVV